MKPEFWSDSKLADLPEATRLFFIGLWGEADDAGWLRWDPAQVAHDLYGFDKRAARERRVISMMTQLVAADRVRLFDCGHGFIPNLVTHQRFASPEKRVYTFSKEHLDGRCPQVPADPRGSPRFPDTERNGKERKGTERGGTGGSVAAPPNGSAAGDFRERTGIIPEEQFGPRRHLRKVS